MFIDLTTPIKFLTGIGEKKAVLFEKELQIFTVEDFLYYFPYKYVDKTQFYTIDKIDANLPYVQIKGKITNFRSEGEGVKERLKANFTDGTNTMELVWFKGIKWVQQTYKKGVEYVIFGKPNEFQNEISMVHPEIEEVGKQNNLMKSVLDAHYSVSERMKKFYITSKTIHKLQQTILKAISDTLKETLPAYFLEEYNLLPLKEALLNIHYPQSTELLKRAEYRLKFEELFYIQLKLVKKKVNRGNQFAGLPFGKVGEYFNDFFQNHLPFELTEAQKRVIREMRKDLGRGKQMNRLLQGDVGSGKTLVALMVMLLALDNGYQACLMAPTEILANQHLETISTFLEGMNVNVGLLTGSTKKKERTRLHELLLSGELQLLIGTHALLEDIVQFKNLGFVVIDEQHRFGVAQRAKLWKKNDTPPHVLVMTATPIPRTLAMTLYGDLDVSIIDELPPGRKPIKTVHRFDSQRLGVFSFMREELRKGRQIYVVYPLIKESESMDYKDLEDGYESITRAFPSPEFSVCIVHGQMKAAEKDASMQLFASGRVKIMVATTVIEVGVNVPNASVMVIESAERFGLSQLHQLRGRVGRGAEQSYCILMTSNKLSKEARMRLETMVRTNDGFQIADVDMKLRGAGDLEGTQQSGVPITLKIANLALDTKILEMARAVAEEVLAKDNHLQNPENQILLKQLHSHQHQPIHWGVIS